MEKEHKPKAKIKEKYSGLKLNMNTYIPYDYSKHQKSYAKKKIMNLSPIRNRSNEDDLDIVDDIDKEFEEEDLDEDI